MMGETIITRTGIKRSKGRLVLLLFGISAFIAVLVISYLSYPNFTLFWNQDALPIITQVMWYCFVLMMGVAIGVGAQWRSSKHGHMSKRFLEKARSKLTEQQTKPSTGEVLRGKRKHNHNNNRPI